MPANKALLSGLDRNRLRNRVNLAVRDVADCHLALRQENTPLLKVRLLKAETHLEELKRFIG